MNWPFEECKRSYKKTTISKGVVKIMTMLYKSCKGLITFESFVLDYE